jgi:hypothetical protein
MGSVVFVRLRIRILACRPRQERLRLATRLGTASCCGCHGMLPSAMQPSRSAGLVLALHRDRSCYRPVRVGSSAIVLEATPEPDRHSSIHTPGAVAAWFSRGSRRLNPAAQGGSGMATETRALDYCTVSRIALRPTQQGPSAKGGGSITIPLSRDVGSGTSAPSLTRSSPACPRRSAKRSVLCVVPAAPERCYATHGERVA